MGPPEGCHKLPQAAAGCRRRANLFARQLPNIIIVSLTYQYFIGNLREWLQTSLLEIPNHEYFIVKVRNTESYKMSRRVKYASILNIDSSIHRLLEGSAAEAVACKSGRACALAQVR